MPQLLATFKNRYSLSDFFKDSSAGLVVSIVALPMALSFAIASGARPEQGFYTAVVAGFVAALFTGSKYQITGPTGAFILLVSQTITKLGPQGLLVATILAGIFLLAMGFFRCGKIIEHIPDQVISGFTAGIAVIIFGAQLEFVKPALAMAVFCIAIIVLWPKFRSPIPGTIVAIALAAIFNVDAQTVGERYGAMPKTLAWPQLPLFESEKTFDYLTSAFAIALLAGIESLLSALVADKMTGSRHNPNVELISQGAANIASGLFGGIPATGAIVRTATNIRSQAVSPVAALLQSVFLLIMLYFCGPVVSSIPMCALGASVIVVAYKMSEWPHCIEIIRRSWKDACVLIVSFCVTIGVGLVTGIASGVIVAKLIGVQQESMR